MKNSILKIKDIKIDETLYPRVKIIEHIIKEYAKDMEKGDIFPPVRIALFKGRYLLVDGRHRLEALELLGEKYAQCEIQKNFPSKRDIFLAAIRANLKHGKRLGTQDKEKILLTLKNMRVVTEDISKLVGIDTKKIDKAFSSKLKHVLIRQKSKQGKIPLMKEMIPKGENGKMEIVDEEGIIDEKRLKKEQKEEWQIEELTEIYNYLKKERLAIKNKKIKTIIKKIKTLLKKRYPKL